MQTSWQRQPWLIIKLNAYQLVWQTAATIAVIKDRQMSNDLTDSTWGPSSFVHIESRIRTVCSVGPLTTSRI